MTTFSATDGIKKQPLMSFVMIHAVTYCNYSGLLVLLTSPWRYVVTDNCGTSNSCK